ncbi:MAG: hypothetical protein KDD69_07350, partial [Bdellovibrionales bacterium]|nr:hypothetical protein [Bdellovibrionales bacterium]
ESEFHSLVGLSGSCFAVRRELCKNLATDIPSDFALLLEAQRQGYRGVHAPDVIASYRAVRTEGEEFNRKVRTVLRGLTTLFARPEVMDPARYGVFAWQVLSHKLLRWLVPWLLLLAGICTFIPAFDSMFYRGLLLLELGFLALAFLGGVSQDCRQRRFFRIPLFFVVVNAAIAVAWVRYWAGKRQVFWDPSQKAKSE